MITGERSDFIRGANSGWNCQPGCSSRRQSLEVHAILEEVGDNIWDVLSLNGLKIHLAMTGYAFQAEELDWCLC